MSDAPEPVDYFNPTAADEEPPDPDDTVAGLPACAIPLEFDTLLTKTNDHAALNAIETALRAMKIAFHRSDDGRPVAREVLLHVKAADFGRAAQTAGRIFARRARVREMLPRGPKSPQAPDIDGDSLFDPLVFGLRF